MKRTPKRGATLTKRRRRRVINVKRLILSTLLLLLVFEVALAALTSPWFYVKQIRPVGNNTVPSAEIIDTLKLPSDTNIFVVNKRAMANRVMQNPVLKDARVHRRLPGTLLVRVVERKPDLILSTSGVLYEVDDTAVPFRTVRRAPRDLPVISCDVESRIVLGQKLVCPVFNTGRECLLLARKTKVFRVAKLTVDQSRVLCLNVRDGYQVRLGTAEQLPEKLDIAAQAVEQIPEFRQSGEYVDVSCPEAPALKLAE